MTMPQSCMLCFVSEHVAIIEMIKTLLLWCVYILISSHIMENEMCMQSYSSNLNLHTYCSLVDFKLQLTELNNI